MIITATGETRSMLYAHTCILNVSHRLREIPKADRLNFKIVPNRHQATDFYQIKIELYKQIRYGTNVTGFGGGVSSYRYEHPFFLAQMLFYKCSDL